MSANIYRIYLLYLLNMIYHQNSMICFVYSSLRIPKLYYKHILIIFKFTINIIYYINNF